MGNSSSSSGLGRGRRRRHRNHNNQDDDDDDEKQLPLVHEISGHKSTQDKKHMEDKKRIFLYKWKIEGISSSPLREGVVDLSSGIFEFGGYTWFLNLRTTEGEDRKSCISLRLCVIALLSDWKVEAEYNLLLYDRKHSNHIKETGTYDFNTLSTNGAFHYLIPLEEFKDASSGFLINDSCMFGIEILRVLDKSPANVISEHLSLYRDAYHGLYTWKIQSCRQFEHTCSEAFIAGGLKWYILLFPEGEGNKYFSVYLKLDNWYANQIEPGVYVQFSLWMKDQIRGKHIKKTGSRIFNMANKKWGFMQFLTREDFNDPNKGFIVANTCIVEASVAVVGSLSRDNNLVTY